MIIMCACVCVCLCWLKSMLIFPRVRHLCNLKGCVFPPMQNMSNVPNFYNYFFFQFLILLRFFCLSIFKSLRPVYPEYMIQIELRIKMEQFFWICNYNLSNSYWNSEINLFFIRRSEEQRGELHSGWSTMAWWFTSKVTFMEISFLFMKSVSRFYIISSRNCLHIL